MSTNTSYMPDDRTFKQRLNRRNQRGTIWRVVFGIATGIALFVLALLLLHIINQAFGLVIVRNNVNPSELSDRPLEELTEQELTAIVLETSPGDLLNMVRDGLSAVPANEFRIVNVSVALAGNEYPEELADTRVNDLAREYEILAGILETNLNRDQIQNLINDRIIQPRVERSWRLLDSITQRSEIEAIANSEEYENDTLEFRAWLNFDFLTGPISSFPTTAGLFPALLGSIWVLVITVFVSFPLGVGAAIYLEEYAKDNFVNRMIELNIRNLAAVPSIVYGLLGLAVFARALSFFTSGEFVGITDTNGRTILSAGLTLALLILPVVIVNAQEAILAVPSSIRDASYGLGGTKWQTVSRQVLPAGLPGIMTGVILSMARAIGETAPLLVVGASTFLATYPDSPFDKFTVVPIQIFAWTSDPNQEFRKVAAAAIIALLVLMIAFNIIAIVLRNRFSRRLV